MQINRETAMRLWSARYGKQTKVKDFAGRVMAKSAYGDRNSSYGWNLDHIYPQSKGGKTVDHNLVCAHIISNDEKGDRIVFNTNGRSFEVKKVENHYEIHEVKVNEDNEVEEEETNLYLASSGTALYKRFKGYQTKKRFVGSVEIIIWGIEGASTAVTDFVEEVFIDNNVFFEDAFDGYGSLAVRILVKDYEMPHKGYTENLLDKCVLLNTYMKDYFLECGEIEDYVIEFRLDCYSDRHEFYKKDKQIKFIRSNRDKDTHMFINTLAILNSTAKKDFEEGEVDYDDDQFYEYDYVWTDLSENLKR